jgi:DNA-binding NarL/FixJ family response regulator
MTIKVLIVDDHSIVVQGLKNFLAMDRELEVVGTASGGQEALELAHRLQPQVVLLDLLMPGMDGLEVTIRLKQELPGLKVLILSSVREEKMVVKALEAGATGYLLKNMEANQIQEAIKASLDNQLCLSPEVAEIMAHKPAIHINPSSPELLTNREKEVLAQLVQGKANKEIALALGVSEGTIKSHISSLIAKMGVQSRAQVAVYAFQVGLTQNFQ